MKTLFITFCTSALLFILISGCKHQPQEPIANNTPQPNNPSPAGDSICFNTRVLPVILSNCAMSGCHGEVNPADGKRLTTYNDVINYVKPFDASDSKLIKVITRTDSERMPPPPAAPLSSETIDALRKWINQGALNSICTQPCDTQNVKFSTHVQPIIKNFCQGCHSGSAPSGGIGLENYNQVKTVADNGKLLGSIDHLPGFSPMPKGSSKMSLCNIRTIAKWIEAGAQNN